jgi:proteasome lid subunit RPN8/RPN11
MTGGKADSISISEAVVAAMIAHARDEAPRECCGLLVGEVGEIDEAVRTTNLETGTTRYLIDPAQHFATIKRLRGTPKDVIGAYHSHPGSPAKPSPTDLAEAAGEGFLYVIVSLAEPERPDVRGYTIRNGESREVPLRVTGA